tara:strand:+ start:363 stop:509 length:147 start_codon:yes stop_codon:yes gene_type:complete
MKVYRVVVEFESREEAEECIDVLEEWQYDRNEKAGPFLTSSVQEVEVK